MKTNKQQDQKNDLIVIDFDQTIFYNPTNDFSVDILLNDIINANTFFREFENQTGNHLSGETAEFILITGRNQIQQDTILDYLENFKGYNFSESHFNKMNPTTPIDENSFLIRYWTAKVKLINQLRLSNEYKSVKVIEDDSIICSMLEKLNIPVFQAKIFKDFLSQTLSITFAPPQKRLMTDLQTILTPRQAQEEQTTNTVKIFT